MKEGGRSARKGEVTGLLPSVGSLTVTEGRDVNEADCLCRGWNHFLCQNTADLKTLIVM